MFKKLWFFWIFRIFRNHGGCFKDKHSLDLGSSALHYTISDTKPPSKQPTSLGCKPSSSLWFFFAPCSTHWAVLPLLLEVVLWFLPPGAVHLMMGQITAVMLGTSARDCDTIPFMALPSLAPCSSPCCSRTSCQKLIKGSISHSHPSSESLTWAIASRFSYPAAQVSEHFRVGALPVELLLLLLFMWTHFQGSAQVDWEHWNKSWDEKL